MKISVSLRNYIIMNRMQNPVGVIPITIFLKKSLMQFRNEFCAQSEIKVHSSDFSSDCCECNQAKW